MAPILQPLWHLLAPPPFISTCWNYFLFSKHARSGHLLRVFKSPYLPRCTPSCAFTKSPRGQIPGHKPFLSYTLLSSVTLGPALHETHSYVSEMPLPSGFLLTSLKIFMIIRGANKYLLNEYFVQSMCLINIFRFSCLYIVGVNWIELCSSACVYTMSSTKPVSNEIMVTANCR